MATKAADYTAIRRDIEAGRFAPVYLLHGDEAYYIDQLTSLLIERVVPDEARDFDLTQYYGTDVNRMGNITEVISACRRFPMVADRQLVMLREVQTIDGRSNHLDNLELYLQQPSDSTVFVITCKGKTFDARKKVYRLAAEHGVVFESKRVRDYELPRTVATHLAERGLQIDDRALQMMCDSIGTDLARVFSEVDKLSINMTGSRITLDDVSRHIGVSKEYNNWELQSAVAVRDIAKVERIRRYFAANPKNNPMVVTLSVLFTFFSNLMLAHYCDDKTERGLMARIGMSYPAAKDMRAALRIYNGWKTMQNIALIRDYDARAKGARPTPSGQDAELLKELLFKLMH